MTSPSAVAVFLVTVTFTLLLSQGACKHHHHKNQNHHHNQPLNHHHRLRHGSPRGCTKCPPGSGVLAECRVHEDTKCRPCLNGSSYSAHHSYRLGCLPCSRCGQGLYIAHPCTTRHDTVCDSCATVRGPRNCDFYARCSVETWNETSRESDVVSGDVNVTSCVNVNASSGYDVTTDSPTKYNEYGDGHDPRDVTTTESEFASVDGSYTKSDDVAAATAIKIEYKSTSTGNSTPTQVPWTFSDGVLGPTSTAVPNVGSSFDPAPARNATPLDLSSTDSTTPFLLPNRTKDDGDTRDQSATSTSSSPSDHASQSLASAGDDVDLDFLTSLMARETWDHSQDKFEDSPQVALLLSRALKDQSEDEHRQVACTQNNHQNGCHTNPQHSAKSEFAHRMEEWHKLDALNTFQVAVIVAVTCAVLLSALWVVVQCRKVRNTPVVTYEGVDSDEEYV